MEDEEEEAGTHGEGQDGGEEGSLVVARQFGQDTVQDGGKLRSTMGKGQRSGVTAGHPTRGGGGGRRKRRSTARKKVESRREEKKSERHFSEKGKEKFIIQKILISCS